MDPRIRAVMQATAAVMQVTAAVTQTPPTARLTQVRAPTVLAESVTPTTTNAEAASTMPSVRKAACAARLHAVWPVAEKTTRAVAPGPNAAATSVSTCFETSRTVAVVVSHAQPMSFVAAPAALPSHSPIFVATPQERWCSMEGQEMMPSALRSAWISKQVAFPPLSCGPWSRRHPTCSIL